MRAADVADADIVIHHALQVALKIAPEQAHKKGHFGARPAKVVFERKGVQREPGKTDPGGCLSHQLNAFGALLVSQEALQRSRTGPAAVSIHDDGHVFWKTRRGKRRVN